MMDGIGGFGNREYLNPFYREQLQRQQQAADREYYALLTSQTKQINDKILLLIEEGE